MENNQQNPNSTNVEPNQGPQEPQKSQQSQQSQQQVQQEPDVNVEDLKKQIEVLNGKVSTLISEKEKYKDAFDKKASELSAEKKKHMTQEELRDSELNELREQLKNSENARKQSLIQSKFQSKGFDEDAAKIMSESFMNGDFESFANTFDGTIGSLKMEIESLKMGNMKQPNQPGNGSKFTLEDFLKMSVDERMKFKQTNPNDYARFIKERM